MASGASDRFARVTTPRIDVYRPAVDDRPAILTADHIVPPGPLPKDIAATIPSPFPFILWALLHSPTAWLLTLSGGAGWWYGFQWSVRQLSPFLATTIAVFGLVGLVITVLIVATRTSTERAIVIRKTAAGRTVVVEQKWARSKARAWGDSWRWPIEDRKGRPSRRRLLIIDAQDIAVPVAAGQNGATEQPARAPVRPFFPFLAPTPMQPPHVDPRMKGAFYAPSRQELGSNLAMDKVIREWLDVRNANSDLISMALLALLMAGTFILIFLGGGQISSTLKETRQESLSARINAAVHDELDAQLQRTGPQGLGQAPPLSK